MTTSSQKVEGRTAGDLSLPITSVKRTKNRPKGDSFPSRNLFGVDANHDMATRRAALAFRRRAPRKEANDLDIVRHGPAVDLQVAHCRVKLDRLHSTSPKRTSAWKAFLKSGRPSTWRGYASQRKAPGNSSYGGPSSAEGRYSGLSLEFHLQSLRIHIKHKAEVKRDEIPKKRPRRCSFSPWCQTRRAPGRLERLCRTSDSTGGSHYSVHTRKSATNARCSAAKRANTNSGKETYWSTKSFRCLLFVW